MQASSRGALRLSLIFTLSLLVGAFGLFSQQKRWDTLEAERENYAEDKAEAEREAGAKPGAEEEFFAARAYPLKTIPFGARQRAIEEDEANEARRQRGLTLAYGQAIAEAMQQAQPRWETLGPQPIANVNGGTGNRAASGRATAVVLDPNYDGVNNQTVYMGAAQGGLWKSTDNGMNWIPLLDDQPSLAVGAVAIDPRNPQVIYVGTGEGNGSGDSYYGAGLLKTTDGGATWRLIRGPESAFAPRLPAFQNLGIIQLTIDPQDSQTLYLCTRTASNQGGGIAAITPGQRGVWKTTDGGETWRNLEVPGAGIAYAASELLISPADRNTVFAGVFARGIYRSTQGGAPGSWELLSNGLPTSNDIQRIEMAAGPPLAPATLPTLYAVVANTASGLHGVYRSTDNGNNWTQLSNPANIGQTNYNLTIEVDPQNANIVYFGMVNFYRSLDGGQTWINQTNADPVTNIHVDQHFGLVVKNKPNVFFMANDGGMYRSDNANATGNMTWVNLNNTLDTIQFTGVALHPTNPAYLLGGTQDNGTNRYVGNKAWTNVAGGDGGYSYVDQFSPNIVWHSFQNSARTATANASYGPRVSQNAGDSWTNRRCCGSNTPREAAFHPDDRTRFYAPIAGNAGFTNPYNVVYWGTQRVYRTNDLGVLWYGLGPNADNFGLDFSKGNGTVTTIAAHPKLDTAMTPPGEIVWVGTSDGNVQVTTEAGKLQNATVTNVTKAPLPNRFVSDFALDPNNRQRAYVGYSGFNANTPTTPGHVFVTDDLGGTWRDISGDLPDVPVLSLTLDPANQGTVFVGTDIGVFQTTDNGASWVRLGNNMPRVASYQLRFHEATRALVVATHGRGIFRLPLAAPVTTVSAANFKRDALAAEGMASAFGQGLAATTEIAAGLPLPTTLAGTSVRLTDSTGREALAPLFFVSPQQVNYQIPAELAAGTVTVTIMNGSNVAGFGVERVRNVAPALFAANANGNGVPAGFAVRVRGGVQTIVPIARREGNAFVIEPLDLGPEGDQVVLVLYGSGFRRRTALNAVSVTLGGVNAPVAYAGNVPSLVGLDQLNALIPRALLGRGEIEVSLRVDGLTANALRVGIR